jgi:hypothetical protein
LPRLKTDRPGHKNEEKRRRNEPYLTLSHLHV